jgi:hypothetical protein
MVTTTYPTTEEARQEADKLLSYLLNQSYSITDLYQYTDKTGMSSHWRVRLDHPDKDKKICPISLIEGKWELKEPKFPSGKPLYNLHEIYKRPDETVWIVEGEKCADALCETGLLATTSGSATSANKADWEHLKDRSVVIWPDNDDPGIEYAKAILTILVTKINTPKVVNVNQLNLPEKGDCVDWLMANDNKLPDWDLYPLLAPQSFESLYGNESEAAWQEQKPLYRSLPEPDQFPVDALGNILGGAVEAMSEIIQAPKAICANSILASATLAIQGHANVVIDGRVHPTSNFFISIGESGERKSAVDREALKPHSDFQEELRTKHKEEVKRYCREAEAYKKAKDDVVKKSKGYDEKLRALEKLGDEPVSPLLPFVISEEPTYEGLVKSLEQGQPSQGLFSDEGGRFIGGHGMNSDNALKTASGLSGLWDGKPISRMRAGDGSSLLVGRRLSLHLMVQPNIAQMILSNSMLIEQGLLSRCLCVYPKTTAGTRKYKPIDLTKSQPMRAYRDRISEILHTSYRTGDAENELQPHQVELGSDAKQVWQMFHDKVEEQLSEYGTLSTVRGFGNKAPEHGLRSSTVLAGFYAPEISNFSRISSRYIRSSTILIQYYLNEQLRLFNSGVADPSLQEANKLLEWLRTECKKLVTLPEIYQYGPNSIRDARKARNLMKILSEHGYALPLNDEVAFEGKVRKEAYEVRV